MKVDIINKSTNILPAYAKPGDAGMDIRADFSQGVNDDFLYGAAYDEIRKVLIIFSGGRALVPTNLFTAIPEGYEVQIRPRSGLALKEGVTVLNTPGTIDAGYRNSWGVILMNLTDDVFEIEQGDRIAQAILNKFETIEWNSVDILPESERGLGGYGSTGMKEV
jgi:dUTP pyrophosphatase